MLQQITKENYELMLNQFTTPELESMVKNQPYFQQAHLLLAKKYQQLNDPRFDRQLQLAALYTQNRDLFYTIFNTPTQIPTSEFATATGIRTSVYEEEKAADMNEEIVPTAHNLVSGESEPDEEVLEVVAPYLMEEMKKQPEPLEEIQVETKEQEVETQDERESIFTSESITGEKEAPVEIETMADEQEVIEEAVPTKEIEVSVRKEEFKINEPHTFDEWLKAFSNASLEIKTTEEPAAEATEELDQIIEEGISSDYLHELVKEETQYSKGLEDYIKEQVRRRKKPELIPPANENEIDPSLVTETMAKVYEMQKKYAKAIRSYELLSLKYPRKSDLFAARINYLKNLL